jgi:SAM domain (Sterile alpha motif)
MQAKEWLDEIKLGQYAETFTLNCGKGSYLSRKRLAQIKLTSFPMMNIQNFEHQKLLLEHIRHTLKFAYHNPVRKEEVEEKMKKVLGDEDPALEEGEEEEEGEGDGGMDDEDDA